LRQEIGYNIGRWQLVTAHVRRSGPVLAEQSRCDSAVEGKKLKHSRA
jgi:hypothetical protein